MGGSTDASDAVQLAVKTASGIDIEFSVSKKLYALMPLKGAATGADLYEEVEKVQSLDIHYRN